MSQVRAPGLPESGGLKTLRAAVLSLSVQENTSGMNRIDQHSSVVRRICISLQEKHLWNVIKIHIIWEDRQFYYENLCVLF